MNISPAFNPRNWLDAQIRSDPTTTPDDRTDGDVDDDEAAAADADFPLNFLICRMISPSYSQP